MTTRRRLLRAQQEDDSASVLSTPAEGALAMHTKASDGGTGLARVSKAVADLERPSSPAAHTATDDLPVLNAFWTKTDLTLVIADPESPNGVRFRRTKAEHSCLIRTKDLKDPAAEHRRFNSMAQVRKALWEGEWLRVCFHDRDALGAFCKWHHQNNIPTFEGMVSPVLRHMVEFNLKPARPRRVWVDIETDSRVSFAKAIEGEARVLCWTLVDIEERIVGRGMLEDDTDTDEQKLLASLWEQLDCWDQVLAWNGDRFDFPVIKERSRLRTLLNTADREWRRWLWTDHLELFKRMNMQSAESGDEKQSFSLNAISHSLLGVGKIDFDAAKTWEEWAAGGARRQRLHEYNEFDTVLMPRIEKKTGFIELLTTLTDACGTFADSRGIKPSIQVEGFLARLAQERGHKFPTVLRSKEIADEPDQYAGAYVLHPQKNAGILRDIHVADFAGLYPNIIRTWNMSPETLVAPGAQAEAPSAHSPLTDKWFRTDVEGILPAAVKRMMELRKAWNDKKAALPPGTEEWKDADRRSAAYKIATNSFYGVVGSATSRFYDREVAESVTQCGAWLIKETIKASERAGMRVVYGDTDSLFVAGATRTEFERFVAWCNSDLYPGLLKGVGCKEQTIKLAYEKQFARVVFTTAKRYIGSYVHYKGALATINSEPEIKGLEFKRGDSLKIARLMQEEIAYLIAGYKQPASDEPADYEQIVQRWMNVAIDQRLELELVLRSTRVNKALKDYLVENPMIRVAKILLERGRDVGEGAKIDYVVIDAGQSPQLVIPAEDYKPDETVIDRFSLWDKLIWPPTERVLEAAFPAHSWSRFAKLVRARKAEAKRIAKEAKAVETAAAKLAAKAERKKPPQAPKEAPQEPVRRSVRRLLVPSPEPVQAPLRRIRRLVS